MCLQKSARHTEKVLYCTNTKETLCPSKLQLNSRRLDSFLQCAYVHKKSSEISVQNPHMNSGRGQYYVGNLSIIHCFVHSGLCLQKRVRHIKKVLYCTNGKETICPSRLQLNARRLDKILQCAYVHNNSSYICPENTHMNSGRSQYYAVNETIIHCILVLIVGAHSKCLPYGSFS